MKAEGAGKTGELLCVCFGLAKGEAGNAESHHLPLVAERGSFENGNAKLTRQSLRAPDAHEEIRHTGVLAQSCGVRQGMENCQR
jgi:hypothetical protein